MKIALIAVAAAVLLAIGIPVVSSFGSDNEASRLVEAAERTQDKADSVSRSYNDVIPPAPKDATVEPDGNAGRGENPEALEQPAPTPASTLTSGEHTVQETADFPAPAVAPGEHPVQDAMNFLATIDAEFGPQHTEYVMAVNRLKRAWSPRYARAVDEFNRFEGRVEHARDMAYNYLEIQQRLTQEVRDRGLRRTHEERDAQEQILILEWMNQADNVLEDARAIKFRLDDMNVSITKLELSATFAAVYEGFHEMPLAITLLNEELDKFHQESELIYQTFGPRANN